MREVTLVHAGTALAGTVYAGDGPMVVLVHGSGPADRGGNTQDWVAGLTGEGLSLLVFDKPGCGASGGDWHHQTFADRTDEALATARFASGQPEAGGRPVLLLGGSQGGWICLLAAAETPEALAGIVTVSGPGVGVREQELYRVRHQLPELGFTVGDAEAASRFLERRFDRLGAGDDPVTVHADEQAEHPGAWVDAVGDNTPEELRFLAGIGRFDPGDALRALRSPVLAIWGGRDTLVPVAESLLRYQALPSCPDARSQLVVFPNADHGLRVPGRAGRAPGLWSLIATWARRL
jgi:pimeloyl-ACP methyl ester carboxylesterase